MCVCVRKNYIYIYVSSKTRIYLQLNDCNVSTMCKTQIYLRVRCDDLAGDNINERNANKTKQLNN